MKQPLHQRLGARSLPSFLPSFFLADVETRTAGAARRGRPAATAATPARRSGATGRRRPPVGCPTRSFDPGLARAPAQQQQSREQREPNERQRLAWFGPRRAAVALGAFAIGGSQGIGHDGAAGWPMGWQPRRRWVAGRSDARSRRSARRRR